MFVERFPHRAGVKGNVNLFDYKTFSSIRNIRTVYALGNTEMKLLSKETGEVQLYSDDKYDWNYRNYDPQSGGIPSSTRDRLILLKRARTGLNDSHGVKINNYGTGRLNKAHKILIPKMKNGLPGFH